jgi:hypothetical protein
MHTRITQAAAALLALTAAVAGGWAEFAPLSFYRSFPLPGHPWVALLGPYNEHLIRDVGGLYLALLVLTGWAAIRRDAGVLRLTGAAWLAFSVPHLVFHLLHLDPMSTADRVGNVVSLVANVVLALLLLFPSTAGRGRRPGPAPAGGPVAAGADREAGR